MNSKLLPLIWFVPRLGNCSVTLVGAVGGLNVTFVTGVPGAVPPEASVPEKLKEVEKVATSAPSVP